MFLSSSFIGGFTYAPAYLLPIACCHRFLQVQERLFQLNKTTAHPCKKVPGPEPDSHLLPATGLSAPSGRRIKRQVIAREHLFFAVTNPGLETLCQKQLRSLLPESKNISKTRGGVEFKGRLSTCYLANLHCRFAVRILMRLADFKVTNFAGLDRKLGHVPWELYLPQATPVTVKVSCHKSRLYHADAVAQHIHDSLAKRTGCLPGNDKKAELTVYGRLDADRLTLSLDSSGQPLFKRGLKPHHRQAPLRETTAAAILAMSGYRPGQPLVDPMCGSGSFSLEAALSIKNIPPGWYRDFAFFNWPAFKPRHWLYLRKIAAKSLVQTDRPVVFSSDIDQGSCQRLAMSLESHGLDDAVVVLQKDFFKLRPPTRTGWIVLNPPYGRRLGARAKIIDFYSRLESRLLDQWAGWHFALLVPRQTAGKFKKLGARQRKIFHGGLDVVLLYGKINR